MAEIIKLGTLYFDGMPQDVGTPYSDGTISFGNTVPTREIQWVKMKNGSLIADRCVCIEISWEQLHEKGFVFGTPVTVDGETYLCRCLRVGTKEGELNEWDTVLDEAGENNDLWHWKNMYFWGQETSKYKESDRAVRGLVSARDWNNGTASVRNAYVGFRPALEPLGFESCPPNTLLGKKMKIYCTDWITIEGRLVDFSDYDIVLKPVSPMSANCPWSTKDGSNIIISRENIIRLKEG